MNMDRGKLATMLAMASIGFLASVAGGADVVFSEVNKSFKTVDSRGIPRKITPDFVAIVQPVRINVDLRLLPVQQRWRPGDPTRIVPRRVSEPRLTEPRAVNPTAGIDPLLQRQAQAGPVRGLAGFTTPILNFEGQNSGVNPHAANGDVGLDYFVQAINDSGGGTLVTFYNKADGSTAAPPFLLHDLAMPGSDCDAGFGLPIVLYDELAGRWVLSELSDIADVLCVYVAQTEDPILGGWFAYEFPATGFPDYPKYAVWPDAYYVSSNEVIDSALYALERDEMLLGNAAQMVRFLEPLPDAFLFGVIPPVDHDGATGPPGDAPGLFIRHFDDEAHDPGNNDPNNDFLQIWEFTVDWTNTANSSITGPIDVEIAEFDSDLCGFSDFECFPQPGTNVTLDPLREVVMNLPKYRNFGSHESIVGNLTTDVDGSDHGGVRWFELRRSIVRGVAGDWILFQEGSYAPDIDNGSAVVEHRWMAASAMDSTGNIAIGFNLSNDSDIFPSLTYDGRLVIDPPGVLTAGETTIVAGGAAQTASSRWGDYSSMSVDPEDGCTFWFTSNYVSAASAPTAATRIAAFKFDTCGEPTFSMSADINELLACVEGGADPLDEVTISVGSVEGFSNPVSLGFNPALPAQFMGSFTPAMVTPAVPANSSALNLTAAAGAAPGDYTVTVEGTATASDARTVEIDINVADTTPAASALLTPADGALNVNLRPTFSWDPSPQTDSYELEVATDAGFTNVILQETVAGTAFMPAGNLPVATQLFWRVTASNQCGEGTASATFNFVTVSEPGQCGPGTAPVRYFQDDMESGVGGWTHDGGDPMIDTWVLDNSDANSPTMSWHADNVGVVSDQRLVSAQVAVPGGVSALTLQFWTRFDLEGDDPECFDGGILEYSTDGGTNWTQVENNRLQTLPYTGLIDDTFDNPLGGLQGWCDVQAWTRSVVDLSGLEGQNLRFRFRLGTDDDFDAGPWHIDDVAVQSCEASTLPFLDGFENS